MKILFLSLLNFNSFNEHNIYTDLLRQFINNGHQVFAVVPVERRYHLKTSVLNEGQNKILRIKTLNIQKTNILEKGLATVIVPYQIINKVKKFFKYEQFDLILYASPPITFYKAVKSFKKKYNSKTYLMLKDIFPQNAIDLGLLKKRGLKGIIYKHFKRQEKQLYLISDWIGCMSQANIDYLVSNNSYLNPARVELCQNSTSYAPKSLDIAEKNEVRAKYSLPVDKKILLYGGNLGKPQNIPFVIECIEAMKTNDNFFFLIVGSGTDYNLLENYYANNKSNLLLLKYLDNKDYLELASSCDFGLLFLDFRFTIPNYPSRLLSYLESSLPIIACTDNCTDIKDILYKYGVGKWCCSDKPESFCKCLNHLDRLDYSKLQMNIQKCLKEKFDSTLVYNNCFKKI